MDFTAFEDTVLAFYRLHRREMPWRENTDPYWVLVSEVMLQQTQADRVVPKFREFTCRFPNVDDLAKAPLAEVLQVWSGLGYNRRAKYLQSAAVDIVHNHGGIVPKTIENLVALPGIGRNTASAILAYAYNQPVVFIETNIRSVYLHHFFQGKVDVDDNEILPIVEETLEKYNPREWYWALMDYGAHLKSALPNPSRASKHHQKQSKFEGSNRQIRGRILRELTIAPQKISTLSVTINDSRFSKILDNLVSEGLVQIKNQTASL